MISYLRKEYQKAKKLKLNKLEFVIAESIKISIVILTITIYTKVLIDILQKM